jgi:hypothetical protein
MAADENAWVLHSMSMTRHIVVVAALVAIATTSFATTSFAQNGPQAQNSPQASVAPVARPAPKPVASKVSKPYFVEFRARSALSYGHTFAVYGRVGAKIGSGVHVAGLHPFTDSSIPWMIGHLVPVPSETGASDGDTENQYIIARYRVLLTEAEYRTLTNSIKKLQDSSPVWHAVLYNCNAFVADIAKSIGLKTPSSLQMPKEFIEDLKQINSNATVTVGRLTETSGHGL